MTGRRSVLRDGPRRDRAGRRRAISPDGNGRTSVHLALGLLWSVVDPPRLAAPRERPGAGWGYAAGDAVRVAIPGALKPTLRAASRTSAPRFNLLLA